MFRVCLAQINTKVGGLKHNHEKITTWLRKYSKDCDLIVFHELSLTGYPPQDLITNQGFLKECKQYLKQIVKESLSHEAALLVGAPTVSNGKIYNSALFIHKGKVLKTFKKIALPNYGVFDEKRWFSVGSGPGVVDFKGKKICVLICEDIWNNKVVERANKLAPDFIVNINSSPFDMEKMSIRLSMVKNFNAPVAYVNQVGGQDDLVFDGKSFVTDSKGEILCKLKAFEEDAIAVDFDSLKQQKITDSDPIADIYNALILGLRDYVQKTGFKKTVLGLSGGIDSALVAAIASDALGAENVLGIRLPSRYSSDHSLRDASDLALNLGCMLETIDIEEVFKSNLNSLSQIFLGHKEDLTEENLQARIRGILLMAVSNKKGSLLLATGNKSEYACGYSTLYGDTCGAFAPIKDIYKTKVYELSKWRNKNIPTLSVCQKTNVIPLSSIEKVPSAELRHNQTDQDSLPDYEILDAILTLLIEKDMSVKEVCKQGFDKKLVTKVYRLLILSEYKRYQVPIGTKVATRDLKRDRRYPIQNSFSIEG
jgi:NAD+ synthetase